MPLDVNLFRQFTEIPSREIVAMKLVPSPLRETRLRRGPDLLPKFGKVPARGNRFAALVHHAEVHSEMLGKRIELKIVRRHLQSRLLA